MRTVFAALAVIAGIATSLQAAVNANLSKSIGLGPVVVANTVVVLACAIGLWVATGASTTWFPAGASWTQYLGGVFGFVIVASAALVFPKLGAAWAIALMVLGQCVAALAIDHYGWLGMEKLAVTPLRLLGIGLVVAGAALLRL